MNSDAKTWRERRKGQILNIKRRGNGKRFTGLHVRCQPDKEDCPLHLNELKWLQESLNEMVATGNDWTSSQRPQNSWTLGIISTRVSSPRSVTGFPLLQTSQVLIIRLKEKKQKHKKNKTKNIYIYTQTRTKETKTDCTSCAKTCLSFSLLVF